MGSFCSRGTTRLGWAVLTVAAGLLAATPAMADKNDKAKAPKKPPTTTSAPQPAVLEPASAPAPTASSTTTATGGSVTAAATVAPGTTLPREMKVLLVTATTTEPAYEALTTFLDRIGIPYRVLVASSETLTRDLLVLPGTTTGAFQAVILTSGGLAYESSPGVWESAFSFDEWSTLWAYEAEYGVRQAAFYVYPGGWPDTYGLTYAGYADTSATPLTVRLTGDGATRFPYLVPSAPIQIKNAWTYLAQPEAGTIPLLQDQAGNVLGAIKTYPDGREGLAFTMDHEYYLTHSLLLHYGAIQWVTRGAFLGERHVYSLAQPDDLLIPDDMWDVNALSDTTGKEFRMSAADLNAFAAWQRRFQALPNFKGWKLEWPFNGFGYNKKDGLSTAVANLRNEFYWISHTWDHENLDAVTYQFAKDELTKNNNLAKQLKLPYTVQGLVTPDISGLNNPEAMKAMGDVGVRYVVSDTSRLGGTTLKPNTGQYNIHDPRVLMIPRYPTNIFYNTRTPAEETSEYNHLYNWYWGRDLTYGEILDVESDNYLRYMLQYSISPLMFHQPNAGTYDGTHSLLSDVFDRTAAKYNALLRLPVLCLPQADLGKRVAARMQLNAAGVTATLYPGQKIVLRSLAAATVPLTGVAGGGTVETYGGESISWIPVKPGTPAEVPIR
jgi:hypothetical protein